MKEPSEARTKYRRNSTFPSLKETQDADIDPESLLLPLARRRRSRRVSTVDGLKPGGDDGDGGRGGGDGTGAGGDFEGGGGGGVLLTEYISMQTDCR